MAPTFKCDNYNWQLPKINPATLRSTPPSLFASQFFAIETNRSAVAAKKTNTKMLLTQGYSALLKSGLGLREGTKEMSEAMTAWRDNGFWEGNAARRDLGPVPWPKTPDVKLPENVPWWTGRVGEVPPNKFPPPTQPTKHYSIRGTAAQPGASFANPDYGRLRESDSPPLPATFSTPIKTSPSSPRWSRPPPQPTGPEYRMPGSTSLQLSDLTLSAFHSLFLTANPPARQEQPPWDIILSFYRTYILKHFPENRLKLLRHVAAAYARTKLPIPFSVLTNHTRDLDLELTQFLASTRSHSTTTTTARPLPPSAPKRVHSLDNIPTGPAKRLKLDRENRGPLSATIPGSRFFAVGATVESPLGWEVASKPMSGEEMAERMERCTMERGEVVEEEEQGGERMRGKRLYSPSMPFLPMVGEAFSGREGSNGGGEECDPRGEAEEDTAKVREGEASWILPTVAETTASPGGGGATTTTIALPNGIGPTGSTMTPRSLANGTTPFSAKTANNGAAVTPTSKAVFDFGKSASNVSLPSYTPVAKPTTTFTTTNAATVGAGSSAAVTTGPLSGSPAVAAALSDSISALYHMIPNGGATTTTIPPPAYLSSCEARGEPTSSVVSSDRALLQAHDRAQQPEDATSTVKGPNGRPSSAPTTSLSTTTTEPAYPPLFQTSKPLPSLHRSSQHTATAPSPPLPTLPTEPLTTAPPEPPPPAVVGGGGRGCAEPRKVGLDGDEGLVAHVVRLEALLRGALVEIEGLKRVVAG